MAHLPDSNTTYTDTGKYKAPVINKSRYTSLSQDDKELFDGFRNMFLEIFPETPNPIYSNDDIDSEQVREDMIRLAENAAFVSIDFMNSYIDKKVQSILETEKQNIMEEVQTLVASLTPATGTGTV